MLPGNGDILYFRPGLSFGPAGPNIHAPAILWSEPIMRLPALSALVLAAAAGVAAPGARAAEDAAKTLHGLFDAEWDRSMRENPQRATYFGDHRFDDRWPDLSPAAIDASHAADGAALAAVDGIAPSSLDEGDRSTATCSAACTPMPLMNTSSGRATCRSITWRECRTPTGSSSCSPSTPVKDYENWIARIETFDLLVDQTIGLMRAGIEKRLVQPRVIMQRVPAQIAKQLVDDPTASPWYAPFRTMPASIPAAEQERLRAAARTAIAEGVLPAYRRFDTFFAKEYLPATRDSVGIRDVPGGEQWYQQRIRWFTTTDLTADQIHDIGQREVARIRGEMQRIVEQVGFKGSLAEFMQDLRTDPRFRYTDPKQLMQAYLAMSKRIDPLLPEYFGRLPRMPYGVRPIPAHIAPDTTTAYYQGPSIDGRRAGYYYVNLYKPEERPTYEIPVLSIHEAVPGHHLQIALAQELGELPMFRRNSELTAFIEGWGLYSESLGQEMGLYEDPYDKFGQLTYEMWRAVRLVVDTGMHHKRWTRQQAIDFFKANAAKTELDIVNEIDRYIAWPGQALAYKIGELRIKELRARATKELGDKFDIRAFHDVVLGSGAVPLDVLDANVARWQQQVAAGAGGRSRQPVSATRRRRSVTARVGAVLVGGDHPVVVQSMTNTDTADVEATVQQVRALAQAGSELVRVTVNTDEAAAAVPAIVAKLARQGVTVPIVGDFHFNGHKLLREHPDCAAALAKYRINPGNVGRGSKRDPQFAEMIEVACRYGKPVRIGVNWGSLDQDLLTRMMDENSRRAEPADANDVVREALVVSALESARRAEELGLPHDRIVISCKVSGVQDLIAVYRNLASRCDYPLHLGLTEAGMGSKGIVASTAAMAVLLQEGIGDTIRVSLTPEPGGDRTQEVIVAQEMLQTMGLRSFTPMVVACPGCGRTTSSYFQELAQKIQGHLRHRMPEWRKRYPGVEDMTVAVMGCVVNGPGESKHANIGISLPGTGERPVAPVYIDGEKGPTLKGERIAEEFQQLVEEYVARTYGAAAGEKSA